MFDWITPHHGDILAWFGLMAALIVFFAALTALPLLARKLLRARDTAAGEAASDSDHAGDALRERYLRAEVGADVYETARKELRDTR